MRVICDEDVVFVEWYRELDDDSHYGKTLVDGA
jgi:hypothetical protein